MKSILRGNYAFLSDNAHQLFDAIQKSYCIISELTGTKAENPMPQSTNDEPSKKFANLFMAINI